MQSDTATSVERQSQAIHRNARKVMNNTQNVTRWLMVGIFGVSVLGAALAIGKTEPATQARPRV